MIFDDLPEWAETTFDYPVSTAEVVSQAGTLEIQAPDQTDSETLETLLERSGETTYQSPEELLNTIRGNLGEEYIGRKYYDDRGANPQEQERDTPRGSSDESF